MVGAHAALPHATEGEAAHSQVDHRVVDAAAAETQGAQDPPFRLAAAGEEIEGQWGGPLLKVGEEPIQIVCLLYTS